MDTSISGSGKGTTLTAHAENDRMHEMICVDPGKTTGWARFYNGTLNMVGEVEFEDTWNWLRDLSPDLFVVEDYIIRPGSIQGGYNHQWNRGHALQIIGAIKYHATVEHCEMVLQQPAIKPLGYKFMGGEYVKGKKGQHMKDAVAHGFYYLSKQENAKILGG